MNLITDTWRGLVRRKLWPVALLLVGALVAVPLLLSEEPAPLASAAPANAVRKDEGLPATFVSTAEPTEDSPRRRVLGESKDPFAPAPLPKKVMEARKKAAAEAKKAAAEAKKVAAKAENPSGGSPSGDAPSGGGSVGVPPVSAAPTPAPTYPRYSIEVRFGKTDGEKSTKTLERMRVLPSSASPLLIYRGVEDGGKVAVFELTGSVDAMGDGRCEPNDGECTVLKLRAGETEFLTISDTGGETDAQYQLQVLKIHTGTTTSKAESDKASEALKRFLHRASLK
jgi:hypothetical protein